MKWLYTREILTCMTISDWCLIFIQYHWLFFHHKLSKELFHKVWHSMNILKGLFFWQLSYAATPNLLRSNSRSCCWLLHINQLLQNEFIRYKTLRKNRALLPIQLQKYFTKLLENLFPFTSQFQMRKLNSTCQFILSMCWFRCIEQNVWSMKC